MAPRAIYKRVDYDRARRAGQSQSPTDHGRVRLSISKSESSAIAAADRICECNRQFARGEGHQLKCHSPPVRDHQRVVALDRLVCRLGRGRFGGVEWHLKIIIKKYFKKLIN